MRALYLWLWLFISCFSFVSIGWSFSITDTIEYPFEGVTGDVDGDTATDIGKQFKEISIEDKQGVVQRIMRAFKIDYIEKSDGQTATYYAKEVLNWLLAILGLVALLMLLFGFYKMFVAKDHEEWFTHAKKIITNALVAIIIIALAWFLVSWFFKIYDIIVTPESIEAH